METVKYVCYFFLFVFSFFSGYILGTGHEAIRQKRVEDMIVEVFTIIGKFIDVEDDGKDDCK